MKKRGNYAVILDKIYVFMHAKKNSVIKTKYAHKRLKMTNGGYNGSKAEFRSVVAPFWKKYGIHAKKFWYDIYCEKNGRYDARFIPDSMWFGNILPYYNNLVFWRPYTDKGMLDRMLPGIKQPETVIKNVGGYFYTGDNRIISKEEAASLCEKEERLIFKPSLYSGGGRLIQFYESKEMDKGTIWRYFDEYNIGFTVQRILKQHPDLARIHPESLNTVRIITFHFQDEVHVLSAQLRMGAGEAKVDNVTSGGCACPIKADGWLQDKAVTRKSEWSDHHPGGLKFKDIRVPNYDQVVETAKRCHQLMPYFNIIGWDIAVSEDGSPVVIEFNLLPDQNQIGSGEPTFGNLTEAVLEDVFIKKTLENKFT